MPALTRFIGMGVFFGWLIGFWGFFLHTYIQQQAISPHHLHWAVQILNRVFKAGNRQCSSSLENWRSTETLDFPWDYNTVLSRFGKDKVIYSLNPNTYLSFDPVQVPHGVYLQKSNPSPGLSYHCPAAVEL